MMMQEPLVAKRILGDFRTGSTLPVLVETTSGLKRVVKWKCTGEGPLANAVDWVSLHLATFFGIPVPSPHLIMIGSDLIDGAKDPEINDLITRSLGVNLSVEFIERARPFELSHSDRIDPGLRNAIYLFDVLFQNIDRTDHNPNMILAGDKLYCIDFAAAMSLKMLITRQNHSEQGLLSLIRRHPFYSPEANIDSMTLTVKPGDVSDIVDTLPDEWLFDIDEAKTRLHSGITKILKESHSILKRRLSLLNSLQPESAESIRERTLNNKKAFEAKWGKF